MSDQPIDRCIADWHRILKGQSEGGLDALLADEVRFFSPIVFTPAEGKEMCKMYLNAAASTFSGQAPGDAKPVGTAPTTIPKTKFRYMKEVLAGHHAVLEFESEVEGKWVNGVDIITCDDESRIVEFRVMIRPLQAIQAMHAQMAAMLKKMQPA